MFLATGAGRPKEPIKLGPFAFVEDTPPPPNPKVLVGAVKLPILSVVPPASIIAQAAAMRYGAYIAKRVDGQRGYGPYNWRDQPVELETYIDAAMRHLLQFQDGEDYEEIRDDEGNLIDRVPHLGFAIATLGIILDAAANQTLIDNRPKVRKQVAGDLLQLHKLQKGVRSRG